MENVNYLDYEIVNSGNGDGYIITKPKGQLYECNLGNYKTLESAKRHCILFFMIGRPEIFATNVRNRMIGLNGTYHDYYLLKRAIENEKLSIPDEITISNDGNCSILFMHEKL